MPHPSKQQIAGHLGVANNPKASSSAQRTSRQFVLNSCSGAARPAAAGKIGVSTNPNASKSTQHRARVDVMHTTQSKK